jgi:hypothetical protein
VTPALDLALAAAAWAVVGDGDRPRRTNILTAFSPIPSCWAIWAEVKSSRHRRDQGVAGVAVVPMARAEPAAGGLPRHPFEGEFRGNFQRSDDGHDRVEVGLAAVLEIRHSAPYGVERPRGHVAILPPPSVLRGLRHLDRLRRGQSAAPVRGRRPFLATPLVTGGSIVVTGPASTNLARCGRRRRVAPPL